MMKTALITGASNGIGLELAKVFAAHEINLILVARSEEKLKAIADELVKTYGIAVTIFAKDLSQLQAAEALVSALQDWPIHYLVNNAGVGDYGFFNETDWNKNLQMINLNMTTLTYLTKMFMKQMVNRREGRILNVASTAAFQPGPTMAVYYATKAYVLHLSEAIANELKGTGVTVTALCPGATQSGFQAAAALEESKLVKGKKLPTAKEVAEFGFAQMMKGKTVAVHGMMNYLMSLAPRFLPRNLITAVVRAVQAKAN